MDRFIGIDMALCNTGLVETDSDLQIKRQALIRPTSKGYPRVYDIASGVLKFIKESPADRIIVAIEDYVIGRGFKTGMDVLKAQGGVVLALRSLKCPVLLVHPGRLRHLQKVAKLESGAKAKHSEHEEDAWGLAAFAAAWFKPEVAKGWPDSLVKLVSKLEDVYG